MTSDCEHCEDLAGELRHGGVVSAAKAPGERVNEVSEDLHKAGAHHLADGGHRNFLPIPGAA